MKKKTALKLILPFFAIFTFLLEKNVNAQSYIFVEDGEVTLNANIDQDYFSQLELDPFTVEQKQPSNVEITTLKPDGTPKVNRTVEIYIEGDDTGVTITQPPNTDMYGETTGSVYADSPGTYTVCALDTTEGFDINIEDCESLYVTPVPTPTVIEEPQYTEGLKNAIYWNMSGSNTYQYTAQTSKDSTFTPLVSSSSWILNKNYEFTNLQDGTMYFYRVQARNSYGAESSWSNTVFSVQDQTGPLIEVASISDIGDNNVQAWDNNYEIQIKYRITDNVSVSSREFWCVDSGGDRKDCEYTSTITGDYWDIKFDLRELDKQDGMLLPEYQFCVESKDSVNNVSRNCDATLEIPEPTTEEPSGDDTEEPTVIPPEDTSTPVSTATEKLIDTVDQLLEGSVGQLEQAELETVTITATTANIVIGFGLILSLIGNIPYFLLQIILGIQSFLGFRREENLNGYVYDSTTKEPVKQAVVRIFNENNELVWSDVTDNNGYFNSTILDDGEYFIKVTAGNYEFPSKTIFGKKDFPLENVYHGETFLTQNGRIPIFSIPLDSKEQGKLRNEVSEFFYNTKVIWRAIHVVLFIRGFFFSIYTAGRLGTWWSYIVVVIYVPSLVILLLSLVDKEDDYGKVVDEKGEPVEGAIVALHENEFGKLVSKRVTDSLGRYRFIIPQGEYTISIMNSELKMQREGDDQISVKGEKEKIIKDRIKVKRLDDQVEEEITEPLKAL